MDIFNTHFLIQKAFYGRYFFALAVTLVIFFNPAYGQTEYLEPKSVVPPTPNAMKMTEYHAQRPNMYTGTTSVSIPLHTIDFDGWKIPLSISYNATGIRTNEEASEVGLGWALNATGVISRTIRGGDDLLQGINGEHRGYVYNQDPITYEFGWDWRHQAIPPDGSYYKKLAQGRPDTEPDIFNYNFFGYNGSFILTQVAVTGTVQVKKLTLDATRVTFDAGTATFTVTTPDGFTGYFTIKEKSTTFVSQPSIQENRMTCCGANYIDIADTKNKGKFRVTSTWYLSKIKSPRENEMVFNYDLNSDGSSPYLSITRAFAEQEGPTSMDICIQTIQEHVYLQSIVGPEVRLDFGMEYRDDIGKNDLFINPTYFPASSDLKRFSNLTIRGIDPASSLHKVIAFKQSYFNIQYLNGYAATGPEAEWLRSRLDRLIIDDQEYRFYYEAGDRGLPNKLTKGIDHFGFYNGNDEYGQSWPPEPNSGSFSGSTTTMSDTLTTVYYRQNDKRRVSFSLGKAGLLAKVKYPTRGYTLFDYEPHTYVPDQSTPFREQVSSYGENTAGGARIKSIKDYDENGVQVSCKSYKYLSDPSANNALASPATGKLMTPLFNRYAKRLYTYNQTKSEYEVTSVNYLYKTHSSIPGNSSAEGKVIGYSKVHEIVAGPGIETYRNTYYFENRPNKLQTWNVVNVSYPNLNGQVTEIRNYDSQGKIVQLVKNSDINHRLDSVKAIVYEFPHTTSPFLDFVVRYSVPSTFNTPYTVVTTIAETPSGIIEDSNGVITSLGKSSQIRKTFNYNTSGSAPNYLLRNQKVEASNGDSLRTEYKRASDYVSPSTHLTYMISRNIHAPVIEEIHYRNGLVVSATANQFEREIPSGPRVNLIANYAYKRKSSTETFTPSTNGFSFVGLYEKKTDFKYEGYAGKLIEYKGVDGIVHSFLWGYNNTLPIAHAVGITNDQLSAAHGIATGSLDYEGTLRNQPGTSTGLVTTFVHNPLVGVLKETNAAQLKRSFQYDSYSRLSKVLDNDGNTLEQHQYHFKELPLSRNFSFTPGIDFGTFYYCNMPGTQKLTLTNDGEDDLSVNTFNLPNQFSCPWLGGNKKVYAGTSIDLPITFNGGTGTYNGVITISTNRTDGGPSTVTIPISANYVAAGTLLAMQLTPNVLGFDISYETKQVTVTNTGNDCLDVTGVSIQNSEFWSADIIPASLAPGQSTTLNIRRKLNPPTSMPPSKIFVLSSKGGNNDYVTVGWPIMNMNLSIASFGDFITPTASANLTIDNNGGNTDLRITGFSSNNSRFTIPSMVFPVIIPANTSQTFSVLYSATDFATQNATLSFNSNSNGGSSTINISAKRREVKSISISPTTLVFENPNTWGSATITNTGNNQLYFSAPTYTYPGGSTYTDPNSIPDWSASISDLGTPLQPGGTRSISIYRKPNSTTTPQAININVNFDNTTGEGGKYVFVVPGLTRIMSVSNITYPSFTASSITQGMTVTNSGNSPLTVSSVSSSNGRFTTPTGGFTVPPFGGQYTVNVTYTPTDFSAQSANIVFNADNTSGSNTGTASGQRTPVYNVGVSTCCVFVKPFPYSTQIITITNNGNVDAAITGIVNSNTTAFTATFWANGLQFTSLPRTISPGYSIEIRVVSADGTYTSASGTITISPDQGSAKIVNLSRGTL